MSARWLRVLSAAIVLGVAGTFAVAFPAGAAPPPSPSNEGPAPSPSNEGPAGPPALMPNGRVATPPRITGPQISANCPAAPSGVYSYAPGSGKTVALTFDDGPGPTTARIMSILASYSVPATFFNIGENAAALPSLV